MADSFADLNRKLAAVERDLDGRSSRASMARVGAALRPEINRAVAASLGDLSMSGWPMDITGSHRVLDDQSVLVEPVKKAKGRMAVLERGRNVMFGPGVSSNGTTRRGKRGNVMRARRFGSRRWNGTTNGKGTMTDASEAIQKRAPRLLADEVHKTLAKHLRGG